MVTPYIKSLLKAIMEGDVEGKRVQRHQRYKWTEHKKTEEEQIWMV